RYKYSVTQLGQRAILTGLKLRELIVIPQFAPPTTAASALPAFAAEEGTLLASSSTGFEENATRWSTTALRSVFRVHDQSSSCEGEWYLKCNGTIRTGGWDGPGVELLSRVAPGHMYQVAIAARFDPEPPPDTERQLTFSVAKSCSDGTVEDTFEWIQQRNAFTDWLRFSGQIEAHMPECDQLSRLFVYVETDDADSALSIHVDDFRILDVTPPTD
ncbi:carbohydrate binding domain-containing protein, partial [Myxococcota bacterium]